MAEPPGDVPAVAHPRGRARSRCTTGCCAARWPSRSRRSSSPSRARRGSPTNRILWRHALRPSSITAAHEHRQQHRPAHHGPVHRRAEVRPPRRRLRPGRRRSRQGLPAGPGHRARHGGHRRRRQLRDRHHHDVRRPEDRPCVRTCAAYGATHRRHEYSPNGLVIAPRRRRSRRTDDEVARKLGRLLLDLRRLALDPGLRARSSRASSPSRTRTTSTSPHGAQRGAVLRRTGSGPTRSRGTRSSGSSGARASRSSSASSATAIGIDDRRRRSGCSPRTCAAGFDAALSFVMYCGPRLPRHHRGDRDPRLLGPLRVAHHPGARPRSSVPLIFRLVARP